MLTRTSQMTSEQLAELDALCIDCKNTDGNIIAVYKHILSLNRTVPGTVLYHEQNRLIGFLSVFFFYEDSCEIAIMVAPSARRQGIAKQMMKNALAIVHSYGINNLVFSTPSEVNTPWLTALGLNYQHSELQMQRLKAEPVIISENSLILRPATLADLQTLCTIDKACFSSQRADIESRITHILFDPSYQLFIAQIDGVPVGKAHIHCQKDFARLTDIAILPEHQGKGLGRQLISHCINYCLANQLMSIYLDVETNNLLALNLYTRQDFVVINSCDFWAIPIQSLKFEPKKSS